MAVQVLVVDDSGFFRRRIIEMLESDGRIEVVGTAANGREAIKQVAELKPDVITMDIEMPVMDGITAVRRIMATHPTPVLMFSSLSYEGAQATLDALEAGAMDFLPKRFDDISLDRQAAARVLRSRVRLLGTRKREMTRPAPVRRASAAPAAVTRPVSLRGDYRLAAIGSSTGGPVALQKVLSALPKDFPLPILLVQHMPAAFTPAFAVRLDQQCAIAVKEAEDGEMLMPGTAYLAPGGRQMGVRQSGAKICLSIYDGDPSLHFRPCVDLTFQSASEVFGGKVLAMVLTGMGADGREGARALKKKGATVWTQDEASCTIYGMPMAVAEAGLTDCVLPLESIGPELAAVK